MRRLLTVAAFFLAFTSTAAAQGRANIYVQNTGDETVWAASAQYVDGDKLHVRGWLEVQPGERELLYSKNFTGEIAVALTKRGGFAKYELDEKPDSKRSIDDMFVNPDDKFDLVYDPNGIPPGPDFVRVETSFAFLYSAGSTTFEQTVTVPSMQTDTVQPMAVPVIPKDFSGKPGTYSLETDGLKRWRNRGQLMLKLAELYKARSKREEFKRRSYDDVDRMAEIGGFEYDDALRAENMEAVLAGFSRALGQYQGAVRALEKMGPEWHPKPDGWNQLASLLGREAGMSWIHLAAMANDADVVADEIARGVNPELRDPAGRTPVFIAMQDGSADAAKVLLEHGAKISIANEQGRTLLMLAASKDTMEQVTFLLKAGADPNRADGDGRTALHHAAAEGTTEVLAVLLEHGGHVDSQSKRHSTPLHDAAAAGERDTAALLLEAGAGLEVKGAWGRTPFLTAGNDATRTLFADAGANVNAQDDFGSTALHIHGGSPVLLELGVDLNLTDKKGATALHVACKTRYNVAGVDVLLAAGAKVNAKDAEGYAPLHRATYANAIPAINSLGQAGADLDAKTGRGQTALDIALEQSWRAEAAAALRALGAKG